tara:strand:- start:3362 stop:3580 length:219 start_codon:yes stop_codon:yes gene_type:complete
MESELNIKNLEFELNNIMEEITEEQELINLQKHYFQCCMRELIYNAEELTLMEKYEREWKEYLTWKDDYKLI